MTPSGQLRHYLADKTVARKIKDSIVAMAWRHLRLNKDTCDDLANDVFQNVCSVALEKEKEGKYKASDEGPPIAWLNAIAANVILSHVRDSAREARPGRS